MIIEFFDGNLESRIIKLIGDFRNSESLGGLLSHEENWKWRKKIQKGRNKEQTPKLEGRTETPRKKREKKSKAKLPEKIKSKKPVALIPYWLEKQL